MIRSPFSFRQVAFAFGAVIVFLLLADFNNRWNEKQRLTVQHERALEERAALEATQAALLAQIEYAQSNAAVEAWAYQAGGMSRPGDEVIVPLSAEGSLPQPTPTPTPVPTKRENWDLWWSLFFDPSP